MSKPEFETAEFKAHAREQDKQLVRDIIADKPAAKLLWRYLRDEIVYDDTGLSCVKTKGGTLVSLGEHIKALISPTGQFSYLGNIPGAKEAAIDTAVNADIEAARHTLAGQGELAKKYPKDWQTMLVRVGLKPGQLGGHAITPVEKPEDTPAAKPGAKLPVRGAPPLSSNPWTQGPDGEAERMRIIKTNARLATSLAKSAGVDIAGRSLRTRP